MSFGQVSGCRREPDAEPIDLSRQNDYAHIRSVCLDNTRTRILLGFHRLRTPIPLRDITRAAAVKTFPLAASRN
jgi:hypothetical protein